MLDKKFYKMNPSKKILLVGRDNWQNDDELNQQLFDYLSKTNHEIIWDDPAGNLLYHVVYYENQQKWLPDSVKKKVIYGTQFIYRGFYWFYLRLTRKNPVLFRSQKLKESILKLGNEKEIIILSRSAGGRFASLIADSVSVKHIICMGYPFQHPENGVEPERYEHLKELKTPMLILQGEQDEYGGLEIKDKYKLSPSIELEFVPTDHEFKLNSKDWNGVLSKISEIVN